MNVQLNNSHKSAWSLYQYSAVSVRSMPPSLVQGTDTGMKSGTIGVVLTGMVRLRKNERFPCEKNSLFRVSSTTLSSNTT